MRCSKALADTIRVGAAYAGTVIGAGFASGQEIVQFFASFGKAGLAGIAVATILFAWLGGRLLELGYRLRATAYHQAIYHVCGRRAALVLDVLTALFLFVMLSVMLAGIATVGRDYLGLPFYLGLAVAGAVVAVTVLGGIRGVAVANMAIAPLLIAAIAVVGLYSLAYHAADPGLGAAPPAPASQSAPHWLLATLIYVSYNLTVGSTILVPLGSTIPHYASRVGGGVLGGLILGGLAAFITLIVMLHHPASLTQEVPILEIASRQHPLSSIIYAAILLAAMYTTALASLYGCAGKTAAATGLHPALAAVVVAAAAAICGQFGFAKLIKMIFPIFGYATLWFTARLAWLSIRDSRWR
ncbi:hypothetical protein [Anaeroselena agilis]|uniref:Membrane protein YkvI n=1 Tax=Anaeroselena agilis TaxID=3063788 RepID=A0ABU3P3D8_9FIRM|nr:hypothetical protein [Selenomonadales bacterium 4137-cl]